ncbi:type II secretion system F family protein [Aeromicrobium sp. UC242_57]|uniref:type II secretion system F family protein n=1 Tax=Aeromicrobium sp. UC242_57 TaxID=3374624 RepID=UPI0037BB8801
MISALLAAMAMWCLVSRPPVQRIRWMRGARRAGVQVDLRIVAASLVPIAGVMLLGPAPGLMLGAASAPVVWRAVGRLESAADRRRAAELAAALPTALDLMVAALEAGRPPVLALSVVAEATVPPLGPELATVASRLAITADPQTVWSALAADPVLGALGRAFARAEGSGMPVAEVVAGVAAEQRRELVARRRQHGRKIAVQTAGPLGACFLPAFFLIGIVPTIMSSFASFLP